jgi:phosphatidyl-myo-inositol dimannoside synthase
MRILIATYEFPPDPGGIQNVAHRLAHYFTQLEHEVLVLASPQPDDAQFDAQQMFTTKRLLGTLEQANSKLDTFQHKWQLIQLVRQEITTFNPDVILCPKWDPMGYLIAFMTLFGRSRPYFVIGHGTDLHHLSSSGLARLGKQILRYFAFHRAKQVFTVSRYTATRAKELNLPESKVRVIRNGIEEKEILPLDPNQTSEPIDSPRILTVCRLVPRKGCDTVIRALPHLVEDYPNLKYQIIGSGPESQKLKDLTAQLNMETYVDFLGRVDEQTKDEVYQNSHLFVMPARQFDDDYEGFGIVYLEAMARGLPVIGASTGGIPDAIEHDVTGLLVQPDDPPQLAEAIRNILEDTAFRSRLAITAWERLEERFLWPDIADEYVQEMQRFVTKQ